MRFLIDAQLPPALAEGFRKRGHSADHVTALGLGAASDGEIWAYATATGAVLVTKDGDFNTLALIRDGNVAVLWIRLGNVTNRALKQRLEPILDEVIDALKAGERLVEVRPS